MKKSLRNTEFPDLSLIDDADATQALTQAETISDQEQKRFNYTKVVEYQDFSNRRMYWSSTTESLGRSLLLFSQIMNLALSYFFGSIYLTDLYNHLASTNVFQELNWSVTTGITFVFMLISFIFGCFIYLPMLISKRAGALHGWATFYIVIALIYFFIVEVFSIVLLTLSSALSSLFTTSNQKYAIYFVVAVLFISIIWIIGACLLIIKSDDVRRQLDVE